jgi:hypothetical protein
MLVLMQIRFLAAAHAQILLAGLLVNVIRPVEVYTSNVTYIMLSAV